MGKNSRTLTSFGGWVGGGINRTIMDSRRSRHMSFRPIGFESGLDALEHADVKRVKLLKETSTRSGQWRHLVDMLVK